MLKPDKTTDLYESLIYNILINKGNTKFQVTSDKKGLASKRYMFFLGKKDTQYIDKSLYNEFKSKMKGGEYSYNPEICRELKKSIDKLIPTPAMEVNSAGIAQPQRSTKTPEIQSQQSKIQEQHQKQHQKQNQNIELPNLTTIISEAEKKFPGQEQVVKGLALNIYKNLGLASKIDDTAKVIRNKSKILLDGPTGTGKTAITKELASKLSVPVIICDTKQFTPTGFVGSSFDYAFIELLKQSNGDIDLAQKGVLCLDEFDKLATDEKAPTNGRVNFSAEIQNELLKLIEGNTYEVTYNGEKINFDTSRLTVIFMGAFTNLREEKIDKEKNKNKGSIGFTIEPQKTEKEENGTISYRITPEDYINYGIKRELVGRISTYISTKHYSKEDLKSILISSSISPLTELIEITKEIYGKDIIIKDYQSFIDRYAEEAFNLNTGARSLGTIKNGIEGLILHKIFDNETTEIELTTDLLDKLNQATVKEASSYGL